LEIRRAEISDATQLLDIRHRAIIELAVPTLTIDQARAWATKHDLSWMDEMIRTKPLWVACTPQAVVAWAGHQTGGGSWRRTP
jgi:putative acetyltransferase